MRRDAKLQKARLRQRERLFRERRISRDYLKPKPSAAPENGLRLISYDVTFEPIPDLSAANQHFEVTIGKSAIQILYDQMYDAPEAAIPELERWCDQFPDVPRIHNWLATAHQMTGNEGKYQEICRQLYQQFPDYLFAIVSECHAHILAGDLDWVANRLDKKWDLTLLYPDRDVFHWTEMRAFQHLLVCYFTAVKNVAQAEVSLRVLEQLDPEDTATSDARRRIAIAKMSSTFLSKMGWLRRSHKPLLLGG